jgi:hypothetical protein
VTKSKVQARAVTILNLTSGGGWLLPSVPIWLLPNVPI